MTAERKPDDTQGGFETSSELRHGETFPEPRPEPDLSEAARPRVGRPPSAWRRWVIALVVVVVVGLAIYFLVTSL
jgi:hypothetical protein